MSFEVSVAGNGGEEKIVLKESFTGTQAEIYAFGALLNSFCLQRSDKTINVMYAYKSVEDAKKNLTPLFQGAKLSPFVCRMRDGKYTFENEKYHIEKYYLKQDAIHGLIFDKHYKIKEKGATETYAFVTLAYEYRLEDKGYPFVYNTEVTYRLQSSNHLSVTTVVTNETSRDIPLSDGWHPYFHLGNTINDLELQFRSIYKVVFDDRLLPTGNYEPYTRFNTPQLLGDTQLDNCFVLSNDFSRPACILRDEKAGLQLSIIPEPSYPYLQIYTPDNRRGIAVENLSSPPDAFNNAINLIILKPGESASFTTAYQLQWIG
ncbi:aldose 1-epimerase [Ilyomonas limi]|uniref:Aldose 1-epimerase n=1 Tax=Ilyomonas limi TaxID=2575867 RepID=A0A4U3L6M5_9BACT|nr:aldose 1-epimerase [Ilyomonas limi]TKK69277.1 aldose 1-epimerase [Ilyomonas limi]